jgi:hypothetical protein
MFDSPMPIGTAWNKLVAAHESRHIVIAPYTAVSGWTGEALDYDLAVSSLMERAHRAKNASAETLSEFGAS